VRVMGERKLGIRSGEFRIYKVGLRESRSLLRPCSCCLAPTKHSVRRVTSRKFADWFFWLRRALKHRYSITLSAPNPPSSTIPLDSGSRPFDARVIASRKERWEGMLEKAVGEWAEAVAKEERENC